MNKTTLYHKTSKGEVQVWNIHTNGADIISEYGRHMGKMQTATKTAKGKNIGKSNETSPEDQAVLQMESMIRKKRDENYHDTIEQAMDSKEILPMLAKDWFKHGHKFKCPNFYVNFKMDGVRCLAEWDGKDITLRSRGNKTYNVPHIIHQLKELCVSMMLPSGTIFDGEIYNHEMTFQDISGAVKKIRPSTSDLNYHIYDMADESLSFNNRYVRMSHIIGDDMNSVQNHPNILLVVAHEVQNNDNIDDTLLELHDMFVERGYEGLIARHPNLLYKMGYRSDQLLKYKSFNDAEFKVLSVSNGVGKFEDMAIFKCEMDDNSGNTFNVVPKGTEEERKAYLTNAAKYIGKMLTVTFFGRSEDNIPRFPVGKAFRMKEDLG